MAPIGSGVDDTMELQEPVGIVGPRILTGRVGEPVRGRFALATPPLEDDVRVEWLAPGRILSQGGATAVVEIDLRRAIPGEVRLFRVAAVLRGRDWVKEIPDIPVELHVER